ncbi:MAG TPA: methionyl-tRNA formyltransferase [Abditibacteriaceae bacterium]|jgi:methionyl-tRNA formyltransferase
MKLIFMGTPALAVPCLDALREDHEIALVVTQPDKPSGRGNKLMPSAVKARALELGLPVAQPEKARHEEFLRQLREVKPEGIAVVAYGQILPNAILEMPLEFHTHGGCVNLHYSLLPRWRGAAPVQHALLSGDEVTGVTCQHMAQKLDAGEIILQREVPILSDETTGDLWQRLTPIGADALREAMQLLEAGKAPRLPQDEAQVTYASMLTKDDGRLNWQDSAQNLHNRARAVNPWPGAWCEWNGEMLKIWRTQVLEGNYSGAVPGAILEVEDEAMLVQTGEGILKILEVQAPGKPRMNPAAWSRGHGAGSGKKFD